MIIARSLWRKAVVTAVAAGGFVSLYEVTIARLEVRRAAGGPARDDRRCRAGRAARLQRHRLLQGHHDDVGRRRCRAAWPPPIRSSCRSARSSSSTRCRRALQRHLHGAWTPGPACRAVRWTSTCGAATRRCSSAAGRSSLTVLRLGWNPRADDARLHGPLFKRAANDRRRCPRVVPTRRRRFSPQPDLRYGLRRQLRAGALVLQLEQPEVDAALRQQLLVRARLAQLAFVQHEDLVHVLDRRQPVRDGDRRPAGHQHVQRVADQQLGFRVDARRRLVENQHARIERQRARERQQLLLADRQRRRRARRPRSP